MAADARQAHVLVFSNTDMAAYMARLSVRVMLKPFGIAELPSVLTADLFGQTPNGWAASGDADGRQNVVAIHVKAL